ncbi:MAG: DUF86 domain-containing protein [Treponema sp.]|nr:DUF86 domain-containing protein [Treponema sp.]
MAKAAAPSERKDDFNKDEVLQKAMLFSLVQISEDSKNLSDEYKTNHNQIPWTDIYGLRNRIVHDYGNVDLTIVFETLKNDIPEVLKLIQ